MVRNTARNLGIQDSERFMLMVRKIKKKKNVVWNYCWFKLSLTYNIRFVRVRVCSGNYPEWDEHHPLHFVGHSAGAQVIRVLQQMLADKVLEYCKNVGSKQSKFNFWLIVMHDSGLWRPWQHECGLGIERHFAVGRSEWNYKNLFWWNAVSEQTCS